MRTRSKKSAKIAPKFGDNSVNHEHKIEAEHKLPPSPFKLEELKITMKVENYNERDGNLVANIVKSEFLEFHSNQAEEILSQNDIKTVLLEKIPKSENEILDNDYEPPSSSYKDNDPFNNDMFRDSELNLDPDPQRDPFADVDCDPSFSRHPLSRSFNETAGSQVQLASATRVNGSSNPPSSAKRSLSTATTSQYDRMRVTGDSKFRCQLCLELRYSETWFKTHLETCAASHKNRLRFCVPCNKLFSSSAARRKHSLRFHGTIVPVPKIKTVIRLKEVNQVKKGERGKLNPYPFKCQFCTCAFAIREPLVAHLTSHPEVNTIDQEDLRQRPYRCQECPITFKHYSVYTGHMMLHKNERAFKCPMPNCENSFNNKF